MSFSCLSCLVFPWVTKSRKVDEFGVNCSSKCVCFVHGFTELFSLILCFFSQIVFDVDSSPTPSRFFNAITTTVTIFAINTGSKVHLFTNLVCSAYSLCRMTSFANPIWDHYTKVDNSLANCNTCGNDIKTTDRSTSGCRYHLRSRHPDLFAIYMRKCVDVEKARRLALKEVEEAEAAAAVEGHTPYKKRKRSLFLEGHDAYFDDAGIFHRHHFADDERRQLAFDMWVTEYLVESSLPISHVADEGFRKFCLRVFPRAHVKPAETLTKEKLPHMFKAFRRELELRWEEELHDVKEVAFAVDIRRTSFKEEEGFLFFLWFHYVNQEWEHLRFLAECVPVLGEHDETTLSAIMAAAFREIPNLSPRQDVSPKVVVHDGSTLVKDAAFLVEAASFTCMISRFDAILKKALSASPLIEELLTKSSLFSVPGIVMPEAGRLSSFCMTISALKPLRLLLPQLSDGEFELLQSLGELLSKFEVAARALSADQSCAMSIVLMTLVNLSGFLRSFLSSLPVGSDHLQRFAADLEKAVDREWPNAGAEERLIREGHFFHPHFRGILLRKYKTYDLTIKELVDKDPSTQTFLASQAAMNTAAGSGETEDLDPAEQLARELGGDDVATQGEEEAPLQKEIRVYLALPKPTEKAKVNVAEWWKHHSKTIPLLARMARSILSVPTSFRVVAFSKPGHTIVPSQETLDPSTLAHLNFCRENWQKVAVHGWSLDQEVLDVSSPASAGDGTDSATGSSVATPAGTHPPAGSGTDDAGVSQSNLAP